MPSPVAGRTDPAGVLRLSGIDSGRTFAIKLGTTVVLTLTPDGGSYDPPTITKPNVLAETGRVGGYPAPTKLSAEFRAIGIGESAITTQTDLACLHTTPPCLPPQKIFTVTITVHA